MPAGRLRIWEDFADCIDVAACIVRTGFNGTAGRTTDSKGEASPPHLGTVPAKIEEGLIVKKLALCLAMLVLAVPVFAQEGKGPTPAPSSDPTQSHEDLRYHDNYFDYRDPCCPTNCCPSICCESPSAFSFSGGFLALRREYESAPLHESQAGDILVTSADLESDYAPGFEVAGRMNLGALGAGGGGSSCCATSCCQSSCCSTGCGGGGCGGLLAEVRYWQVDSFDADLSTEFENTAQAFSYSTRIYNFEANLLLGADSPIRLLGGIRYIRLEEDTSAAEAGIGAIFRTSNDLYGLQLGAEADLYQNNSFGPLALRGFCKAGIYAANSNAAFDCGCLAVDTRKDREAYVVETGLTAGFQPVDWLSLDAGYRVVWLDGVALAGEQFSALVSDPAIISGGLLLHGFNAGLTVMW